MAKSLDLARQAMQTIIQNLPAKTLSYTSYCAVVVKLANGNRAVVVAEAGATAKGINGKLVDTLENTLNCAVVPCADPTPGQGTWHMNDAEQQAMKTIGAGDTFNGATVKAVVANRAICQSCTFMLQQHGLVVNGSEAVAP
jgi:hypothetical protein